jgi:hypothetical protein
MVTQPLRAGRGDGWCGKLRGAGRVVAVNQAAIWAPPFERSAARRDSSKKVESRLRKKLARKSFNKT